MSALLRWASDLVQDLRYGQRALRRAPAFTIVAITTLALGIGANTAMFSVLNTYLLKPAPYPAADRLVRVYRTSIHSQSWPHSGANFLDHRQRNTVFDHMVAFNPARQSLLEDGRAAEGLRGLAVTADFFPALGVAPALGRHFSAAEDEPGANQVAVLSDRFWRARFGGDPNIVGRTLRLEGENVQVIGVMPAGFEHPILWGPVDLWRPMAFTAAQRQNRGNNYLAAFARLKPGVSIVQAEEAMVALAASLSRETSSNQDESLRLEPLQAIASGDVRRSVIWFVFGLAGFVLLIGCANLANIELVHKSARAREHAIRGALGAARTRLLRQSLTESLLLACLGGAASLAIALAAVQYISRRLFAELPGAAVTLDSRVFLFALGCSILTGVMFGMMPAWLASRTDVNRTLKEFVRGAGSHQRAQHALIVGEIAFALVLLAGAGLFVRGLERFAARDVGWQVDGLLIAQIALRGESYATPEQRLGFYDRLEQRLRALPGVQQAALSASQPIYGFNSSGGIVVEGLPEPAAGHAPEVFSEPVSLSYFDTLGVRLRAGRVFEPTDTADRPGVVVINETMAQRFWPGESAVGKRIGRLSTPRVWTEVVGVVDDVAFAGNLNEPYTRLQAFRPIAQSPVNAVNVMLRSSNPGALVEPLRRAAAELDPTLPVVRIRSARSLVDEGLGNVSLLGTLLGAFAILGLVLAAVGVYGVTSYSVAQREGEFGIRMALGAQARDVLRLVIGTGARLVLVGTSIGLAGAYLVGRILASTMPSLPTRDPGAVAGVALALVGVALVACWLPARRAVRLDPSIALRRE